MSGSGIVSIVTGDALRKIESQYRECLEQVKKMQSMIALATTTEEAELYCQQINFELLKAEGYRKQLRAVARQLRRKAH